MSSNRMVIFCAFLLLFTTSNQVLAGHHGGNEIGPLLGGGLLTLLFAGSGGLSSGGGQGRSALGGLLSRASHGGQAQGEGRSAGVLPPPHAMGIPVPPHAFHGIAHGHGLSAPGFLPAHSLMGGVRQVHGLGTHGPFYGGLNAGSLAYNPSFGVGGIGNNYQFLGYQGIANQGLDSNSFGQNMEGNFPMSNLNGHYLSSGADALTNSGISPANNNVPHINGAFMNHAV